MPRERAIEAESSGHVNAYEHTRAASFDSRYVMDVGGGPPPAPPAPVTPPAPPAPVAPPVPMLLVPPEPASAPVALLAPEDDIDEPVLAGTLSPSNTVHAAPPAIAAAITPSVTPPIRRWPRA